MPAVIQQTITVGLRFGPPVTLADLQRFVKKCETVTRSFIPETVYLDLSDDGVLELVVNTDIPILVSE